MFGYKTVSQTKDVLSSRNWRQSKKIAKNRKKASRKGLCSCSRCGRHQKDVSEIEPTIYFSKNKGTFTLCKECFDNAQPEEVLGWVMLHISSRDGYEEDYDLEKVINEIEGKKGQKLRGYEL